MRAAARRVSVFRHLIVGVPPWSGAHRAGTVGAMLISRRSHLALLSVLATFVAAAATAPGASAAVQRYASPGGAGNACSAASPCGIVDAVGGANLDDEVILSPGDYPLAGPLSDTRRITIHGVAGQPRPRLLFSAPNQDGLRLEFGSTLRYVEIDQAAANGNALFTANGVTVDQVIARAPGNGDPAANIQNSTIRNSIVVASGANGRALVTDAGGNVNTSTYRNVTAIATASGGVAIQASASYVTGKATIHLVNVLARAPSGISLRAQTDNSGATATITATHSNYQSGCGRAPAPDSWTAAATSRKSPSSSTLPRATTARPRPRYGRSTRASTRPPTANSTWTVIRARSARPTSAPTSSSPRRQRPPRPRRRRPRIRRRTASPE